jgi:hypothetical protein
MTYRFHYPNPADRGRFHSHLCADVSTPEQLAPLLPKRLQKDAQRLHEGIVRTLRAGRGSIAVQHSPLYEAHAISE